MNFLSHLRLGARLAGAFAAVLGLTVVFGLYAIARMGAMNDVADEIETNWLPSVQLTSEINTNTSDFRILELQHVLSQDVASMAQLEKKIDAQAALIASNRAAYAKLISSPEEQKLYEHFSAEWDATWPSTRSCCPCRAPTRPKRPTSCSMAHRSSSSTTRRRPC